ncbi:hypothetical protein CISIN_1g044430mg, partial [Citrus sinensis]
ATKGFTVVDLAQDYYLVRFSNERDVEYALTEGPWTVMGQYLIVQQWSPSFDVATNKIEKIVAWIRLAEMNIHFYHKNIIRRLGEIVCPVVKMDHKMILSRSSIPKSRPNSVLIAMQGMLAQIGNSSTNPNGIPTVMHGMHEHFNDPNTTFPHKPHATQSPMQDMHAIPSSRIPMHVPTSLNPLHHSVVSFPKIPKPPNLDKSLSSSRTTRGISLAEGHDNYLDGDPPNNFVIEGENHFRDMDGAQSFHSANGKEACVSDEDDSVVAESDMDMGAELMGLSQ